MRLKDLLTCTIGIFLCTSCIKDEAPNAEADIEKCILPADILSGTEIDYNLPFDESLNAYPIYIEVNNGTDLTAQAPTFELTPGATINPGQWNDAQLYKTSALYHHFGRRKMASYLCHQSSLSVNNKYPDFFPF